MNPIFLRISLLLIGTFLFSQEKLRVEYEITPFYEPAVKEAFTVTALVSFYELIVDKDESQYDYLDRIDNTQKDPSEGISGTMQIRSLGTLYKNTKDGVWIEDTKFENKAYLIKDSLKKLDWKITKEKKSIAGFEVLKATAKMDDNYNTEVTAWYSPKLNFKSGPDKFWGLPGLILEVESEIKYEDGGREGTKYTAVKVEIISSDKKIKVPSKGIETNQADFEKMQEDHFNKMMEMYKGGVDKD